MKGLQRIDRRTFTDVKLAQGIEIIIPDKQNQDKERIKEAQQVAGQTQTADTDRSLTFTLRIAKKIYMEEGELLRPPTFDDTSVEKAKR